MLNFDTTGYMCFPTKGITTNDKLAGVYDLNWKEDTLLVATEGYIKYFYNDEWKVYKDTIPRPHSTIPLVTSFTFIYDTVYCATTSDGVLKWCKNKWNSVGKGLPQSEEQKVYPGISFIIAYKDKLFIGFGSEKVWDTGRRGLWKYEVK